MTDTKTLLKALGHARCAAAFGCNRSNIRNMAAAGKIPAKWFLVAQRLASESGVEAPYYLFSWPSATRPRASGNQEDGASER